MTSEWLALDSATPPKQGGSVLSRLARRGLLEKLAGVRIGCIEIVDSQGSHRCGTVGPRFPKPVKVRVHSDLVYGDLAFGGSIGAGEGYMAGLWDCDDLVELMRILLANRDVLDSLDGGTALVKKPLYKLFHRLHRNSVKGSRRNIHAHYDLGNDFFRLFLDETLMYSAARFEHPEMTLAQASEAKLERICEKLQLTGDDHILEIGTGWGGLAIHAASRYGCRVTTTTISPSQHRLARERVEAAGLADRVTLLQKDFRELEGQFDKLVSIEMIEAIGEENVGEFFTVCDRCLKPGGRMVLQAITIRDRFFPAYRGSVDFIQRYIFPGGFLPSLGMLCERIGEHSSLRPVHLDDIGLDYARTLREWRGNFHRNYQRIVELGYQREFMRMWHFYFCYCEAGFLEGATGDIQAVLVKDL